MKAKELPSLLFFKTCNCEDPDSLDETYCSVLDLIYSGVPICGWCGEEYQLDEEAEL